MAVGAHLRERERCDGDTELAAQRVLALIVWHTKHPGSSGTHRIIRCARFGIEKTLKFKAFVPRTHRKPSDVPVPRFYLGVLGIP